MQGKHANLRNKKNQIFPPRIEMEGLPHSSSKLGVICSLKHSLAISSKGEVLGMHVNINGKYQLLKQNLDNGANMFYDFKHEKLAFSVLLFEENNVVFSGGRDKTLVCYNFQKGNVLKIMNLGVGDVDSLFKLGEVACIGGKSVKFVDSNNLKVIQTEGDIQADCKFVRCMGFKQINSISNGRMIKSGFLLLGGSFSPKITKQILPDEISQKYQIGREGLIKLKDLKIEELTKENQELKTRILEYEQVQKQLDQLIKTMDQSQTEFFIKQNNYKNQLQNANEIIQEKTCKFQKITRNFLKLNQVKKFHKH